jgi:hypothetical protein
MPVYQYYMDKKAHDAMAKSAGIRPSSRYAYKTNVKDPIYVPVNRLKTIYQTEKATNPDKVAENVRRMKDGEALAPIVIGYDHDVHDGHHRLEAAKEIGHTHVPCVVGGRNDRRTAAAEKRYRSIWKSMKQVGGLFLKKSTTRENRTQSAKLLMKKDRPSDDPHQAETLLIKKDLSPKLKTMVSNGSAHWVTIKEGALEGRHLLISGSRPAAGEKSKGKILAGHGVPKHVVEKLNGSSVENIKHEHIEHTDEGHPVAKETPKKSKTSKPKTPKPKKETPKTGDFYVDAETEMKEKYGISQVVFGNKDTPEKRKKATELVLAGLDALSKIVANPAKKKLIIEVGKMPGNIKDAYAMYIPKYPQIIIDESGKNGFFHEYGHYIEDAIHGFKGFAGSPGRKKTKNKLDDVMKAIRGSKSYAIAQKLQAKAPASEKKYIDYLNSESELFARFFSQWVVHVSKKKGINLPPILSNIIDKKIHLDYAIHPSELESIGAELEKVLSQENLLKSVMSNLEELDKLRS